MCDAFFIIGAPRSGTTAYARMLNMASNAEVFVEQKPNLCIESRDLIKGELQNPGEVIFSARNEAVREAMRRGLKYGDKNPCYMPFVGHLSDLWDCKIILLVRDGRDVVRSLLDWHQLYRPHVFASPEDQADARLGMREVPWDYSRLRPNPGEPYYDDWKQLSRFEKCAWYWANYNVMALRLLGELDEARWIVEDATNGSVESIERLFGFLGLEGFRPDVIRDTLSRRVNSLPEKTGQEDSFPRWPDWTEEQTAAFERIAGHTMARLFG